MVLFQSEGQQAVTDSDVSCIQEHPPNWGFSGGPEVRSQCSGVSALTAKGWGSISCQATKIPQTTCPPLQKRNKNTPQVDT